MDFLNQNNNQTNNNGGTDIIEQILNGGNKVLDNKNNETNVEKNATNLNGVAETKENKNEIDMQGFLERSEKAVGVRSETNSNGVSFDSSNKNQGYDPLPNDPKERATIFFDKGLKLLFRTIEFNQNVAWNEKEYNAIYGENGIMSKSMEIEKLLDSLKVEKDISNINRKLTETPVDWLEITPTGNGMFQMTDKRTGEIISTNNAEITIKMIETFARMSR